MIRGILFMNVYQWAKEKYAARGVDTEAAITALAIKEGFVPPTINYENPDPALDLNYTPNTPVKAPLTMAISDSLGFGGHNGCIAFKKV